jgi:hypothetical protein
VGGLPGPLFRRIVVTTAVTWLAVRFALGTLGVVQVGVVGTVAIALVVLAVAWLDLRRNTEVVLCANLAVSPVLLSTVVVAVSVIAELLVGSPLSSLAAGTLPVLLP